MTKEKILFLVLLVAISISNMCCAKSEKPRETVKETGQSSLLPETGETAIRFKPFSFIDKEGIGIEAFRMLIPSDWRVEGGIKWVLDNPGMPTRASFRIHNPKGTEELEIFPDQPFFWTNNQMLLYTFPVGSRYFGNEVHPIVGPIEALKGIVVPRFRGGVSNLRVVKEELLPELAKSLGAKTQVQYGVSTTAKGAKIRIEYQQNGRWMEEEIYGVVETISFPIQTMAGTVTNTNWVINYLFSFKAEKGRLDAQTKLFQTMIYSFKLNPQWFNRYNHVVEYLIQQQIQRINNIGQLSRIISQTNNEISDIIMGSYNQRQAVYDKISTNFSQYIRGVDEYHNPIDQRPVELPSGYTNAWTNSLGEYLLSDDPNFNPNIGSTQTWQTMKKR